MALRLSSNRSLFSLSWVYLVLIFLAGMFITGMLARSEITADRSRDDALNTSIAASVAMQIGTSVGEFYTPTVAGEGFVSSAVAESQDLEVPEAQILDTSFEPFVGPLVSYLGPALLDYQLAPAGVVTYSSRPEQNAAALGHNLFLDDERRDTILLTVEQRQPIVSGPVDLIQGGTGVIIRQAIFLSGLSPFRDRYEEWSGDDQSYPWMDSVPDDFWGFATTVIDFDQLMAGIDFQGLTADQYALRVVDVDGELGERIFGEQPEPTVHTVGQDIILPDGSRWQFQVTVVRTPLWSLWPIFLAGLAATIVIVVLVARGYSVWRRNRLGFTYSHAIADLTEPSEILTATSTFLADAIPDAKGSVGSSVLEPILVPIPPQDSPGLRGSQASNSWPVIQSGELQAVIRIQDAGSRVASQ